MEYSDIILHILKSFNPDSDNKIYKEENPLILIQATSTSIPLPHTDIEFIIDYLCSA